MNDLDPAALRFIQGHYEKWQAEIDSVQSLALAAQKHKFDGDIGGMHHYLRHARQMMRLLSVDISELTDPDAIEILTRL